MNILSLSRTQFSARAWLRLARARLGSVPGLALLVVLGAAQALAAQTPPSDSICRMCHELRTAKSLASGASEHGAHRSVACVDCHTALKTYGAADGEHETPLAAASCAGCHEPQQSALAASVHGAEGIECAQCHAPHAIGVAAEAPQSKPALGAGICASCHADAAAHWKKSPHALDPGNGKPAAGCADCHGAHDVHKASDARSRVYPLNLPNTCESCHHPNPSSKHPAPAGVEVAKYETSAHGRGLRERGLIVTATCASCHGSHDIRKPEDPAAPTARLQIPYTCGKCHAGILRDYLEGVHGADFQAGVADVPVCNDCHREHAVQGAGSAGSSVSADLVAETCARCHANDELAERYGFSAAARSSWGSSYHGIAQSFGQKGAANCASCHGFHAIFPSKDPRSPVHVDNLDSTCGGCHSGASKAFARVPVHSVIQQSNFVPWIVRTVYTALVLALIGAFLLFIVIDLFGRLRVRLGWGPGDHGPIDARAWPDEDQLVSPTETFRRMGYHARIQHMVLIASFSLLVLTGIPVFLHDSQWMRSVIDLEGGFELRSRLHRVGAIGLIGLSLWHLAILAMLPSARRWFARMMFRPRDLTDFAQDMLFSLGCLGWLSKRPWMQKWVQRWPWLDFEKRPALGRYGLVEKLEYGAVVWGNIVMIATGMILWRPGWFLDWTPSWTFEVCRVVHGFEATLAFLAIVIWHMYHVHLRPGVFPMSRVWLNGVISREELRHHHPGEYLELLEARRAKARAAAAGSEHA